MSVEGLVLRNKRGQYFRVAAVEGKEMEIQRLPVDEVAALEKRRLRERLTACMPDYGIPKHDNRQIVVRSKENK